MTIFKWIKEKLLGKPLATGRAISERLTNLQGLAIFGADAMSSTAYATEEILLVLVSASIFSSIFSVWTAMAIVALILIIVVAYRQVIYAYPQGGGVYNVAKENLGETAALIGGASLWVDYILTVAVSVAAGVAAITSAFPALYPQRIIIGIMVILVLMWTNLRGVRESGKIFAIPTYIFIISFALMIIYGAIRFIFGNFPVAVYEQPAAAGSLGIISIALIIRAFASGCTALTGIEATSNGVQAFKPPESKNAAKTLTWLGIILGFTFLGITLLAYWGKIIPMENETLVSQIANALFGHNPFYYLIQIITALILLLAANTPFAGFPRAASMFAKDGYFPRQFYTLGSRLVFTHGIVALAILSSLLIIVFSGSVHALIPLYAVGVFLGFAISQLGMMAYWKKAGRGHAKNILINVLGFIATSTVFLIVLLAKFTSGAWVLAPSIILILLLMHKIKKHYLSVEKTLSEEQAEFLKISPEKIMMIVFVSKLNRLSIETALFARGFKPKKVRAFHVAFDQNEVETLKNEWEIRFPEIPIDIIIDEFREIIPHAINYVRNMEKQWKEEGGEKIIAVIPMMVPT
ncbi:MAG: APC family permease, partial [Candidatus Nealsonbacteria bacterium]|nr:APC family permease [Candidatus Nealsonbacteria bacterium]